MIKDEAFIDLELSLAAELLPRWEGVNKRIVGRVAKAIEANDFSAITDILETAKATSLYRGKLKKIRLLFKTGLLFGASRISGEAQSLYITDNKKVMLMATVAQRQYQLQLEAMMLNVRKRIMAQAIKLRERLDWEAQHNENYTKGETVEVQKVNPINMPNVLRQVTLSAGKNMINIASSLQMSRMAGYGFVAEASARGITTYKINERLDNRTCPVCKRMHGKIFKVKDAYAKLDTLIRITDPNDLKMIAPWPKQDSDSLNDLDQLNSDQLRSKGWDTPPFHPRCRGLLAVDKSASKLTKVRPASLVEGVQLSKPINNKVAEFLESAVGKNLSEQERSSIIAAAVGVSSYDNIPDSIKKLIADSEN